MYAMAGLATQSQGTFLALAEHSHGGHCKRALRTMFMRAFATIKPGWAPCRSGVCFLGDGVKSLACKDSPVCLWECFTQYGLTDLKVESKRATGRHPLLNGTAGAQTHRGSMATVDRQVQQTAIFINILCKQVSLCTAQTQSKRPGTAATPAAITAKGHTVCLFWQEGLVSDQLSPCLVAIIQCRTCCASHALSLTAGSSAAGCTVTLG